MCRSRALLPKREHQDMGDMHGVWSFSAQYSLRVVAHGHSLKLHQYMPSPTKFHKFTAGLPWWLSGRETTCQRRRHGFDPWSRKTPHTVGQLSLGATTTEPVLQNPGAATTEPTAPRACALQQRKPPLPLRGSTLLLEGSPTHHN